MNAPRIATDSEMVSGTSESDVSSTSILSTTSSVLREGRPAISVVSVAGDAPARSGVRQREYDQPPERLAYTRESASAQHLEMLPSTRAAPRYRNAPPPSLTPPAAQKPGPLYCRLCGQDPCDTPTSTMCGHIFCRRYKLATSASQAVSDVIHARCIGQAITADCHCPVCRRAILVALDV